MTLKEKILKISDEGYNPSDSEFSEIENELTEKLNSGEIRSAEPDGAGGWKVNIWIKKGILLLFK